MISLFDNWFNLFNTSQTFNNGVEGYGLNEDCQNELLDKMSSFIDNMKVHNSKVGTREKNYYLQKGKIILIL